MGKLLQELTGMLLLIVVAGIPPLILVEVAVMEISVVTVRGRKAIICRRYCHVSSHRSCCGDVLVVVVVLEFVEDAVVGV